MTEWVAGGGILSLFGVAALLIWRLVKLGVDQEERLLRPAYNRIGLLEERIGVIEAAQKKCEDERAQYLFLLRVNGIATEEQL